jgi:hypothetical protein
MWGVFCVPVIFVQADIIPLEETERSARVAAEDEAIKWLEKIEERSTSITGVVADLRYDRTQGLVGDTQKRFGSIVYRSGPPSRFAVHFDLIMADMRLDREDRWYIFDGQWFVERYDNEKLFIKRQLVPAPVEGVDGSYTPDALSLGAGPFAIPITQKKDVVLRRFKVAVVEPQEGDSENSFHLHLIPLVVRSGDITEVDLWYDQDSLLPIRVRTVDDSENESIVYLSNVRLNESVEAFQIDTAEPTEQGWRVEVTLYDDK